MKETKSGGQFRRSTGQKQDPRKSKQKQEGQRQERGCRQVTGRQVTGRRGTEAPSSGLQGLASTKGETGTSLSVLRTLGNDREKTGRISRVRYQNGFRLLNSNTGCQEVMEDDQNSKENHFQLRLLDPAKVNGEQG